VGGNVRLYEHGGDIGIDAACHVQRSNLACLRSQFTRIIGHGNRVEVHHTEETLEIVLFARPLFERPNIIANGQITGRLDTR